MAEIMYVYMYTTISTPVYVNNCLWLEYLLRFIKEDIPKIIVTGTYTILEEVPYLSPPHLQINSVFLTTTISQK